VNRARCILPVAFLFLLAGGVVRAGDQPIPTEPVSGSFDREPSQTGAVGLQPEEQTGGHAESTSGEQQHGEPGGINPRTLALQLLNFGMLLFLLIWFGGRKLGTALRGRHDQLKADIQGATDRRAAAEQRFRDQDIRLANLERELTVLRAEVQQAGERERALLLEGAQEKAKRIQEETRFQLDQQVREAEQRLRAEVASTAVKVADELLRRSVSPEDERRLAQDFVAAAGTPTGVVR
jgi:F-type H+-transporting ATPase subunit b